MNILGALLVVASIVVAFASLVAIIHPIARLGLGTRKRSLVAFVVSFIVFIAGGILVSDASREPSPPNFEVDRTPIEQQPKKTAQSDVGATDSSSIQTGDSKPKEQGQQQLAAGERTSPDSVDESGKHLPDEIFSINVTKEDKAGIWLAINTTLPDHVDIRISVSRAIVIIEDEKIVGDDGITTNRKQHNTSFSYFSERKPLGKWKKPQLIRIDDLKWLRELRSHLDKRSVAGVPYQVRDITDGIEVSAYAYRNRTGDPYEKREYKSQTERYLKTRWAKKSEVKLSRPWTRADVTAVESSIVNAYYLEINKTYRLIKDETPITEFRRAEDYENIDKMFEGIRYLPAGTLIRVLEVAGHKETRPYYPSPHYRVALPEHSSVQGWILSIALSPDGVRVAKD